MKEIFNKVWRLAKPYYEKGRPMDIDHIEWMMKEAELVCEKEDIDESILMPIVILHDVGYAETNHAYFEKELKKAHMEAGKKIAKEILESVNYPEEKIKRIEYCISVHDNWIFEDYDVYKKDKVLATFNDLDFIWMSSPKGFEIVRKILKKTSKEMLLFLKEDKKETTHPFATKTTKNMFDENISNLEKNV